uniref:Pentatricopeptide repeat-containing protein At3g49740 n=1 Tax=Nicotiana tabacum TaxID=4097 RepID=A0A1S4CX52_TOBAC|nr:PREDICTED: pentatricopeptide repeat-containing protein At3g49740-like [Nicotiana tabacum]XP_016505722.1 PREDICTED: pentatricopeptide repeat-containing protein At3g49740-like [Nicotiana tabacum]XP_016505723.1 PREDICTED: pentatricopeptide repeat-containing protein At3g49740-like [Nicotiana tabacum]XP_016505724.1 PREDICTED: pentatricopeptide repeat-containing protein At3g49740-like [Nicotiana tabacum]XP_016505725.1 PREDICTED: pentatricopeptide repeat-containing protein At3g49740-like [Nicotiana
MKFTRYNRTLTESSTKQLIRLNCLLSNRTRSHQFLDALHLFNQIHSSNHLRPDHYTLSTTLTACANIAPTSFGNQLHAFAINAGLKEYPHVSNSLLSFYAKSKDLSSVKRVFSEIENADVYSWTTLLSACAKLGEVEYACQMFDEMPQRNLAVWNAMITGCAESGRHKIALNLFQRMHFLGVRYDNYAFASVLSLCHMELLDFGRQVHSMVIKTGFLSRASVLNALVTMYFNCKNGFDALLVFEEAGDKVPDPVTYNAMIAGLVSTERAEEALIMFKDMQKFSLRPTELTFVSILSSCSHIRIAYQLHAQVARIGLENYTSIANATITMYASCGDLNAVSLVFERLKEKDTVSWNAMITSYAQNSLDRAAIFTYLQMQREGIEPDEFTMGSVLASSESLVVVEIIFGVALKKALILKTEVSNALLSAFCKHGEMNQACQVFNDMFPRNLISWNTLISGCHLNGLPLECLHLFSKIVSEGLMPNPFTLSIILSVCASISALQQGKEIHAYILKSGLFSEISLGNALITLYAKCGMLHWSLKVFQIMTEKDIVSWNSVITAYAQHGKGREAVHCFEKMQELGVVKPDNTSFNAVLSACSHSGLIDKGIEVFTSMIHTYGIEPTTDHFSCIVDLLGRAGYLDEAEKLVKDRHVDVDSTVWWTLFSSCAAYGDVRLGRIAAGFLLETEKDNPTVYVLLSNIYANAENWEDSANVRKLMNKCGMLKQPGSSWIGS